MSTSTVSTSAVSSSSERFIGRVKWFNNKAGYGFINITDGPKSGTDVFVHHSSINVDSEQYKYLVQGEYVNFNLSDTKTNYHEYQAGEVCGINGGKLMCETRRETRVARSQYISLRPEQSETYEPVHNVTMPRSVVAPKQQNQMNSQRVRTQRPCDEEGVWTYVSKSRNDTNPEDRVHVTRPTQNQRGSSGRGRGSSGSGRGRGSSGRGRELPPRVARGEGDT